LIKGHIPNGIEKSNEMKAAYNISQLKGIVEAIDESIRPYCTKLDVAGSYRRNQAVCHDLEFVVLPEPKSYDLFGEPVGRGVDFVDALNALIIVEKGNFFTGRFVQGTFRYRLPVQIDLFLPQPCDYYRILALRTGPSAYSGQVLARAWVKKGWCGTVDGLRLQKECRKIGDKWICQTGYPTLPPVWQGEQEFFEWLGLAWVPAWQRGAL